MAVFPHQVEALTQLSSRARAAKVSLVVWPLLQDAQGRWPSASNVDVFAQHVHTIVNHIEPATLLFDVEPPIDWARRAVQWRYVPRPRALGSHAQLAQHLRREGWTVEAVVPPMLLYGAQWERWLGTPVADLECERVEPMLYTSLFEGYSRGAIPRRVARDLLVRMTRVARGAVSLGVVGGGALGDERAYRSIDELRDDVALARAAGAKQLSLYALDGMLERGNTTQWLDAFVYTQPGALPRHTRRGAIVERVAAWLGGALT